MWLVTSTNPFETVPEVMSASGDPEAVTTSETIPRALHRATK